jgi:hypothetical protein
MHRALIRGIFRASNHAIRAITAQPSQSTLSARVPLVCHFDGLQRRAQQTPPLRTWRGMAATAVPVPAEQIVASRTASLAGRNASVVISKVVTDSAGGELVGPTVAATTLGPRWQDSVQQRSTDKRHWLGPDSEHCRPVAVKLVRHLICRRRRLSMCSRCIRSGRRFRSHYGTAAAAAGGAA